MKIKDGFVIRKVAESYVVLKLGGELNFNGMITLNETGAFIWNLVSLGFDESQIAEKLTEEYEIDRNIALSDVNAFIIKMREADVLE